MDNEKQRQQFEAAILGRGFDITRSTVARVYYLSDLTDAAWIGWQAAQQPPALPERVVDGDLVSAIGAEIAKRYFARSINGMLPSEEVVRKFYTPAEFAEAYSEDFYDIARAILSLPQLSTAPQGKEPAGDERERFETWFFRHRTEMRKAGIALDDNDANSMWTSWQAAKAPPSPQTHGCEQSPAVGDGEMVEKVYRAIRRELDKQFNDTSRNDCFSHFQNSTKAGWCDVAAKAALAVIQKGTNHDQ